MLFPASPGHGDPSVDIVTSPINEWLDPSQIELSWRTSDLGDSHSDRINVKVFGYREEYGSGSGEVETVQ